MFKAKKTIMYIDVKGVDDNHYMEKLQHRGRCAHCGDPAIRTRHTKRRIRRGRGLYQPCDAAHF